jgi:hypothetical protein
MVGWTGSASGDPLKEWNELPRVTVAEAVEEALVMIERFHGLYLRTLKALQDRRSAPAVVVRRGRQVNVGQQQVNVGPP